ncbi:MAG: hypothetical protein HKO53_02350 [Gemmatimonadetes bacterium]|nr:hypothetical protein [Gemmatimonadota bacterium]
MDQRFLVLAIVVVPVLSVCLGFTVHYAIRPLIESLLDAIDDLGKIAAGPRDEGEVARLQAEVGALRAEVSRMREASSNDAALIGTGDGHQLPPGAA